MRGSTAAQEIPPPVKPCDERGPTHPDLAGSRTEHQSMHLRPPLPTVLHQNLDVVGDTLNLLLRSLLHRGTARPPASHTIPRSVYQHQVSITCLNTELSERHRQLRACRRDLTYTRDCRHTRTFPDTGTST